MGFARKLGPWYAPPTMDVLSREVLWGVVVWRLAAATGIIFLGFLSRRLLMGIFAGTLKKFTEKTAAKWDDDLVALLPTPVSIIAQLLLWALAVEFLNLPEQPVDISLYLHQGLEVGVAIALAWTLMRLVDVLALAMGRLSEKTESRLDDQLVPMLRKTLKVVVVITIFVMVVQNLGYSVTSLVASLGVGGLALALAAKDTVANLFGSVVVFADRPFQVGDWVEFAGIEGTIEEVGFRTTRVRRFDKSLVVVPNQMFSTTPITNHSLRPIRRLAFDVGLTYETKAAEMRKMLDDLRDLVKNHEDIDQTFSFVQFTQLGDCSLNIRVYCFSKSTGWLEYLALQEDMLLRIMELVEANGLEMAFPTQTLYLRDEQWPTNQPQARA